MSMLVDEQTQRFVDAVNDLARGTLEDVTAYFHVLEVDQIIEGTRTTCRVHWLTTDGNGRPRLNALAKRLAREIVNYCIPREEILEASEYQLRTGSTDKTLRLAQDAKQYFSDLETSGEAGELLLYFLMEKGLGLPQIMSKMPLKTNSRMMIHGVDGVHAMPLPSGGLAVYWGESKIYADFSKAISDCFDSIAPFLLDAGGGPLANDILLARKNLNVGDQELSVRLAEYFDQDSPQAQLLEARGACLVGFGHDPFLAPYGTDAKELTEDVAKLIAAWRKSLAQRVQSRKLASFEIEFFCLPLPSAETFRDELRKELGIR